MIQRSVSRRRQAAYALAAAACLAVFCGRVQHSISGNVHSFYNALWATAACVGGGLIAATGGWYLRPMSERLGWGLMAGGVIAVIMSPTIFFEKTVVKDDGFFVRSGLWG